MSWLLKQAEDILNRVDQQTSAAIGQHQLRPNATDSSDPSNVDASLLLKSNKSAQYSNLNSRTTTESTRRWKKQEDSDLLEFLNSSAPASKKSTRTATSNNILSDTMRTSSSPNMVANGSGTTLTESIASKSASTTPRSTTPAEAFQDEDEGLVLSTPSNQESSLKSPSVKKSADTELKDDVIASLHAEIQMLMRDKRSHDQDLQNLKRQQILYQQQITESDALLRDLRSREGDFVEAISAKDTQIALLRVRLAESDGMVKHKAAQCEQLQSQCARILQDHSDSSGLQSQAFDSLQSRLDQLEQELQQRAHESERLTEEKHLFEKRVNDEKQQLIEQLKVAEKRLHDERLQFHEQQQQVKQNKNLIHQLEQDMQEYKGKAQRILQTKDKLIEKLKEIVQSRVNSTATGDLTDDLSTNDNANLADVHHVGSSSPKSSSSTTGKSPWASVQYEELKVENELFKQELQAREFTIHTLRSELQESELLVQHAEEQLREQAGQLNEQLKDERSHLTLAEQDCRKLKQELNFVHDDFHRQKQVHLTQLNERERELERLRLQLTAKSINHVNDDELEKRLQTLTESLIHKQTIIEALQTEKSSLTMQLERLEKRIEDYDRIASTNINNSSVPFSSKRPQATTIPMEMESNNMHDIDHDDTVRYRIPLLRETPYDPDITKKVKRAANEIDKLGVRLGIFLKRYPAVRLGVIFYAILLHLWTLIVLFTYKPEIHGNLHSLDASHIS